MRHAYVRNQNFTGQPAAFFFPGCEGKKEDLERKMTTTMDALVVVCDAFYSYSSSRISVQAH